MPSILMLLEFEFPHDDRVEKEALTLVDLGFRVAILCPTFSGKSKQETYKGIEIFRFSINKNYFKKLLGLCQILPFYHNLWRRNADNLINKLGAKIIHIHDLPLCKLGVHFKNKYQLVYIADMHENYPAMVSGQEHIKRFPNKLLININGWYAREKKWLQHADQIICTAPGMIDRLTNILGQEKSFILVPNTINPEEFAASQHQDLAIEKKYENKFVVLYYGGVSQQRGIQNMIQAVPVLSDKIQNLKVVIVGDGSYLDELKNLTTKMNVSGDVDFEGWQSQSKLASYMKNTSIAVIPHLKSEHTDNTSPNKLFMFMYFGKPTLSSNCNYLINIIEKTNSGIIFESGNTLDLAKKILRLYQHPDLKQKLGENAKKSLLQAYNWDKTVEPLRKIYKSYFN